MKKELYKAAQEAIKSHNLNHEDTFTLRNSAGTEYFFIVDANGEAQLLVTSINL